MHSKANKPWPIFLMLATFAIGACAGASALLMQEPQQVAVTTQSQGKCVISNGMETHEYSCQIIQSGIAYIALSW